MHLPCLQVVSFLPHVLSKTERVKYGLLLTRDIDNAPATMAEARRYMAVPFVGKDLPSRAAEFANPEVLIGLTLLAYRYEGMRPIDSHASISHLKAKLLQESGAFKQRPSSIQYEDWISKSSARGILPLQMVQTGDPEQMGRLHEALRVLPDAVHYTLLNLHFPRLLLAQRTKLSASGQELGSGILWGRRLGFSGTPSDLLPTELKCHFEPGSEGRIVHTLSSTTYVDHTLLNRWTVASLLKAVATHNDPPFHALIDTGALVTGMSNREVAENLLREGLAGLEGCVYLDDNDKQMVLLRSSPHAVPIKECGLPWEARFTFYDQAAPPRLYPWQLHPR